jgi:pimeloyl-ACP methyl ester carboxylesterase
MLTGFFGDREAPCYRAYHPPAVAGGRLRAVLLCHVGPEEYRHTQWAYRQLAGRLADAGVHAMRFDWSGTGDSAGDLSTASLDRWTDDVATAAAELRDLAGVTRLSLVGMRLGATIAARAVARGVRVQELVLWDPVVSGQPYLEELEAMHTRIRLDYSYPISQDSEPDVLLGYRVPDALRSATAAIDLTVEPLGSPSRVWIVTSQASSDAEQLATRYLAAGAQTEHTVLPDASPSRRTWNQDTLLPRAIPGAIVARLTRATA